MSHETYRQLKLRAGDLNVAVGLLTSALQRDIDRISDQLQDAIRADAPDDIQQLHAQRDRWLRDIDVLRDQVPTLERLASGGVRPGREVAALIYVDKLARAFLLAASDITARANRILSPSMIERLPAAEVESARLTLADIACATTRLKRILERSS